MFENSTKIFDHLPEDDELITSLDDPDNAGVVGIKENEKTILAEPQQIPIWFVLLCLSVPIIAIIIISLYNETFSSQISDHRKEIVLTFISLVAIVILINVKLKSRGISFELNKATKELWLPHLNLTVDTKNCIAIIELSRYYSSRSVDGIEENTSGWRVRGVWWGQIYLTSILLKNDNETFTQLPVVCDRSGKPLFGKSIGRQLAEFLNVPVRRIKVGLKESKLLMK